jgi:hypothetical protein
MRWTPGLVLALITVTIEHAHGETPQGQTPPPQAKSWYEAMSIRGYTQLRYNQIGVTNYSLVSEQGDKSIGGTNGFFLRRARLVLTAHPTDRTMVYIQPDFASTPATPGPNHFGQLRDLYADVFLTRDKSLRIRLGQSKVPFGFENLQSSQNRIPFDRNDALNSAVKDERDLGSFLYWTPPEIRDRFKMLVDSGLKGSGDYGVFALGAYNGQTANQSEANRSLHAVSRITYPFNIFDEQILETSLQAYTGKYVIKKSEGVGGISEAIDQRIAASVIYYPQPLGIQIEYNIGKGPEYKSSLNAVQEKNLSGGYALLSYRYESIIPFIRYQTYKGGKKHDTNSIRHQIAESEIGVEWQIDKALELTAVYTASERTNPKSPAKIEKGRFGRIQFQWNY